MAEIQRSRRTLLTYRAHLLLTGLTVVGTFGALIGVAVFAPISAQLANTPLDSDHAIGLAEHFLWLHAGMWPLLALCILGCIATSTILFQRMRAPLIRFVRVYEDLSKGHVPNDITIRGTDYLTVEADALNAMLDRMRNQEAVQNAALTRLRNVSSELARESLSAGIREELDDALACLETREAKSEPCPSNP